MPFCSACFSDPFGWLLMFLFVFQPIWGMPSCPFALQRLLLNVWALSRFKTIPGECHCLLILNPCDLLSCAALFRPISLNVIVLPCFPILVCWCQISRCLRDARFKNTYSLQMGQRLCLSHFYYILYWPGNFFLIQKSNAQTTFNHCRCMSTYFCIPHIYVCTQIYTYISTCTHTCTYTQAR